MIRPSKTRKWPGIAKRNQKYYERNEKEILI